jgi:hypothetical protein
MLFILFFISLLGTVAFRKIHVFGESKFINKRRCSDDLLTILGLNRDSESTVRTIIPKLLPEQVVLPENTWYEGEVPWNVTDDNDNHTISVKITPPTFDPLEPCSIGHLFV